MELYFALSGLFNAVTSTVLGFFIFFKNTRAKVNQTFALFCLCVAAWSYAYYFWPLAKDRESTLFWFQALHIGAIYASIAYLHFVATWLNLYQKVKKKIIVGYIVATCFALSVFSSLFIKDMVPKFSIRYWAEPGILYHFYLLFFFGYMIYSSYLLIVNYKKTTGIKRNQIKYILIGMILTYIGGSTNYPLWYDINLPPYGNILASAYVIFTAYAIVKYRLMDIRLIIRRSMFYFFLVFYVAGLYAFLSFVVGAYFVKLGISQAFIPLIIAFIIVIGLDPLKKILAKYTDKLFFKDRIDYRKILRRLSEIIAKEIELDDLLDSILGELVKGFKVKSAQVLVSNNKGKFFKPESYLNGRSRIVLSDKSHLIKYLNKSKNIVITEEINRMAEDAQTAREKKYLQKVEKELNSLNCGLCSPVIIENKLTAIIVIGSKLSGDMFSKEDIRLFKVVTPQMAAALEKAKLYEEVQNFSKTMQEKVEQRTKQLKKANIRLKELDKAKSEFLSIAAHQLRTPLTSIKGYLSMLLHGDFGGLSESQEKTIKAVFWSSERLNRLVNVFLNISRIESGRLKLEKKPIVLEKLVARIVNNFHLEAKKKNLDLQFIKPKKKTNYVKIDQDKITDVINNLIDNSLKYTEEGKVIVAVKQDKNQILFSVKDTGVGISENDLADMFNKFSRTTVSERMNTGGSGLGLYIAKRLIEAHHGKVWAKSEGVGQGSEFAFSLPANGSSTS